MPRSRVFFLMISTAGLCYLLSLFGCERSPSTATATADTNQVTRTGKATEGKQPLASSDSPPASNGIRVTAEVQPAGPERSSVSPGSFRPDDRRPLHDEKRLTDAGIHVFESKRLKLYTDLPESDARPLTTLVDELYPAWEEYFGPLPADKAGTDFQMSGYVMRNMTLFRGLGLIPEDLTFDHGSHVQNEFWMRDQEFDYYRRHLVIHEATHCFMTFVPGVDAPRWYLEGMAEYFGAHRMRPTDTGVQTGEQTGRKVEFRVMPTSSNDFPGFGRISIIRKAFGQNLARPIPSILELKSSEFVTPEPYAWSWALCAFLDGTPRYRDRFRELSRHTRAGQFARKFDEAFGPDQRDVATEWHLFVSNLQYGYDLERAAINFHAGEMLTEKDEARQFAIASDRGWQSSRILLQEGCTYEATATGKFVLNPGTDEAKAWGSEPQGISFRYFDGKPLGMLLGCIRQVKDPGPAADDAMRNIISIGRGASFIAPVTGTLYLRLNDAWNSLADNEGAIDVTIRQISN